MALKSSPGTQKQHPTPNTLLLLELTLILLPSGPSCCLCRFAAQQSSPYLKSGLPVQPFSLAPLMSSCLRDKVDSPQRLGLLSPHSLPTLCSLGS